MPFALLYISRNRVPADQQSSEVDRILASASRSNPAHSLTGALVCTPEHYAQVLEGPRGAVMATMARIEADPRHDDVRIVASEMIPQRSFAEWSMARVRANGELEAIIARLTDGSRQVPAPGDVWSLWNLLSELARQQVSAEGSSSA